jgi:putative transposase
MFAAEIRKRHVEHMWTFIRWRCYIDKMYVKINGEMHYLRRAIDQGGEVLESFVNKTRDKAAALTFIKNLMKRHGAAKVITTNGHRSYKAVLKELGNAPKQEVGRWANNRVENSHQPLRRRERAMSRFRRMKSLQKFASPTGRHKTRIRRSERIGGTGASCLI